MSASKTKPASKPKPATKEVALLKNCRPDEGPKLLKGSIVTLPADVAKRMIKAGLATGEID